MNLQHENIVLRGILSAIDSECQAALNNGFPQDAPEVIAHIRGLAGKALKTKGSLSVHRISELAPTFPCWMQDAEGWVWCEQPPGHAKFTHWHPDQPSAPEASNPAYPVSEDQPEIKTAPSGQGIAGKGHAMEGHDPVG